MIGVERAWRECKTEREAEGSEVREIETEGEWQGETLDQLVDIISLSNIPSFIGTKPVP